MLIELFNKKLKEFSQRLTLLRLSRNQLANEEQSLFRLLFTQDQQERGGFTTTDVMGLWMKGSKQDAKQKLQFLEFTFPYELISYSIITKFLKGNPSQNVQHSPGLHTGALKEIDEHIERIFSLELQNYVEGQKILNDINKFIPTLYLKPTKQEFYQYVASQQLSIDIDSLAKALYLPDLPPPKQGMKASEDYKENLWQPSVENLQSTMNRLKNRVKLMGNQFLQ